MQPRRRITKSYLDFAIRKYQAMIRNMAYKISDNKTQAEDLMLDAPLIVICCMICCNWKSAFGTFLCNNLRFAFVRHRGSERRAAKIRLLPPESLPETQIGEMGAELSGIVNELKQCLDAEERTIVDETFYGDRRSREIADDLGMSHSKVCRIRNRAIQKMRTRYQIKERIIDGR